ncbi:polarized growth protein [Apiospora phragmitis]|uniref:Polarized growth protein n=1 Tax=Apiospora phragmitis TaxID=2905665 RepID=A0ABR1UH31_9PEZI
MSPAALLRNVLRLLVPVCVASTVWLYLYPVFLGCAFPTPADRPGPSTAFQSTLRQHVGSFASAGSSNKEADHRLAPFRLLTLGDPQLEGDTSIPNAYRDSFSHLKSAWQHATYQTHHASLRWRIRQALHDLVDFYMEDIPDTFESVRKHIDLFGNDFYLAHIYRTLRWWARPTHVTVLGDLLGSQWISNEEFARRSWRFWNRSFAGGERVPDDVAAYPAGEYDVTGLLGSDHANDTVWRRRIINIAGNHDVGYAGDLTYERLSRFETAFGKAAYELRFELPVTNATLNATLFDPEANPDSTRLIPELRIVVVNDMNLDTPALIADLQDKTYSFVNDVINTASAVEFQGHFTVVLTHIPMYKRRGICVDPPYFDFHPSEEGGGVREQYQLSADASKGFLEGMFGLHANPDAPGGGQGRRGVLLNGHDHEGCDTWHFVNQTDDKDPADRAWDALRWEEATADGVPGRAGHPGLREITVRSMMGQYGGNAGLLSAWFDEETWEWKYEFTNCALGTQYPWWFVHITDLIAMVSFLLYGVLMVLSSAGYDVDQWPAFIGVPTSTAEETKKTQINGKETTTTAPNGHETKNGGVNITNGVLKKT